MLRLSTLLLIVISSLSLAAQSPSKHTSDLSTVERIILPTLDNQALLDAELNRRGPGIAPRFAENIEVNISLVTHGHWEITSEDLAVWRLLIKSVDAKSLNLGFTKYYMPEGV